MKNKKVNKKIITIIAIIITIILLSVICYIFKDYIRNGIFYIRMLGVNKDIIIAQREHMPWSGGYASNLKEYYVDIDNKKIYYVENYYVFGANNHIGEAGNHYTLKSSKKLSDNEINEIKNLTKLESDYNYKDVTTNISTMNTLIINANYYVITYNGKTIELTDRTAGPIENIIRTLE